MENDSILDTIITNNRLKEIDLNAIGIVESLFERLNDREKDVLRRRFGLHGKDKETLEEIGLSHKLTRERIRQIETGGINKIKKIKELDEIVGQLKQAVSQLMEDHGGLIDKNYLFDILINLSKIQVEPLVNRNHLDFLISRILDQEFEEVVNSKYFYDHFRLKYKSLDYFEALAIELNNKIKETKTLLLTSEVIDFIKQLDNYKNNEAKINLIDNFDLSQILKDFKEDPAIINKHKPLYALLRAMSEIEQNKFGQWGHRGWREVIPKTINDKVYLVLKNNGKPMHYQDIAKKIKEMDFDNKDVNAATIHNELILDERYILVGRGLYGLKEWGYKTGTVIEIIQEIIKTADKALTKEEITKKVLEQRLVKQTTINLALLNKKFFEKVEGGKYKIKAK